MKRNDRGLLHETTLVLVSFYYFFRSLTSVDKIHLQEGLISLLLITRSLYDRE